MGIAVGIKTFGVLTESSLKALGYSIGFLDQKL